MLSVVTVSVMATTNVFIEKGWQHSFVYFLVGWHKTAVCLSLGDVIFAQLVNSLNDVIFIYIGNNKPFSQQTLGTICIYAGNT